MAKDRNDDDDDDGDDDDLIAMLNKTRKKPLSFAFGLARESENNVLLLHRKQPPEKLYKTMRMRHDVTSKGAFGIANSEGSTVTLTCQRIISGLKRQVTLLLKQKGIMWKVKIVEADGAVAKERLPPKK
jgi:hypothetical protein